MRRRDDGLLPAFIILVLYVIGFFLARDMYGTVAPSGAVLGKFDVFLIWVCSPVFVPAKVLFAIITAGL